MPTLEVRRLGYALGGAVLNVDASEPLPAETLEQIKDAWQRDIVLCLPNQDLSPEAFMEFCAQFGSLDDNRAMLHLRHPEHAPIMEIVSNPVTVREKSFESTITDHWHTDQSYTTRPSTATFLNAKQLPSVGGDTMFANMYMAYDSLSPAMQRLVESLSAVHDSTHSTGFRRASLQTQEELRRRNPPVVQGVVRVHPETGRKHSEFCRHDRRGNPASPRFPHRPRDTI
jgi:taurine dioxygenase